MFLEVSGYDHCISYLRYGYTWGDWHGGNGGGNNGPYEIVLIGANGNINGYEGGAVDGIVFWGIDGKTYGSYGGNTKEEPWETTFNYALGKATD